MLNDSFWDAYTTTLTESDFRQTIPGERQVIEAAVYTAPPSEVGQSYFFSVNGLRLYFPKEQRSV